MGINFEDAYNELRVQVQKISKSAAASLRRETELQNRVRSLELKLDEAGIAYERPPAEKVKECTCGNVPMGCTCE